MAIPMSENIAMTGVKVEYMGSPNKETKGSWVEYPQRFFMGEGLEGKNAEIWLKYTEIYSLKVVD